MSDEERFKLALEGERRAKEQQAKADYQNREEYLTGLGSTRSWNEANHCPDAVAYSAPPSRHWNELTLYERIERLRQIVKLESNSNFAPPDPDAVYF